MNGWVSIDGMLGVDSLALWIRGRRKVKARWVVGEWYR